MCVAAATRRSLVACHREAAATRRSLVARHREAAALTPFVLRHRRVKACTFSCKFVSKEVVVGNQMRVVDESLSLSSARREYGLVAGDQSAARLARVIIGHVGGDVHTEAVARELVVHSQT